MGEEVVAYRHSGWDVPFWVNPNRSSARFNRGESYPTQYLSLHPVTTWAEYLRVENRRTAVEVQEVSGRVWCVRVPLPDDATVITFENAREFGIKPEDLVSADYSACQDLAERLRGSCSVLRVPSAALPGTENLVVFGPRVTVPYLAPEFDPDYELPAAVLVERGRPPVNLLGAICFKGQDHAGLAASLMGNVFEFREPVVGNTAA